MLNAQPSGNELRLSDNSRLRLNYSPTTHALSVEVWRPRCLHDYARAAVRPYLSNHEPLPPMPESFVLAYYQRAILDHALMQEQVERYMALLEREDGTVADGYDERELERDDFDSVDIDEDTMEEAEVA